jgi:hypothetical protein
MRSVADRLRAELHASLARRSPGERLALALALGARDLEAFRAAHGLGPEEARRALRRRRQVGRQPCRCLADLVP